LPNSLEQAIELAENSELAKSVLGEELLTKYIALKREEVSAFAAAEDKAVFYKERYFRLY